MPTDVNGVRADVIADNTSTISRMNVGRAYELYMGGFSRDNRTRLTDYLRRKYGEKFLVNRNSEAIEYARNYLREMYSFINTGMVEFIDSLGYEELVAHVTEVVQENLYLHSPPDNEYNITDVISESIEKSVYKPTYDKVTYTDLLGRRVTTVENVRIGVMYFMFLDKIANSYSAVSSSKVNNFGFPVKGAKSDKNRYPHSQTPTKLLGETELRILLSNMGRVAAAEMIDLALNPNAHKALYRSILESKKAFDPNYNIDRTVIPYQETKSLQILSHMFTASGFFYHDKD